MNFLKRAVAAVFDFLQSIVVLLAIMVMIYLFVMSPQEISGASMEPNFHNGEYILTNKVEYKLHDPQRGDVVIFKSPRNPQIDYIKRVIGVPGDHIRLSRETLFINDKTLLESYIPNTTMTYGGTFLGENQEIIVPPGKYFVLGDNRQHSSDSREFGPVAKEEFIGKAFMRYWPFSEFGLIAQPYYSI